MEFKAMRLHHYRTSRYMKCVEHIWLLRKKVVETIRSKNNLEGHETWKLWNTDLSCTREGSQDNKVREYSQRSWDLKCVGYKNMKPENTFEGHGTWNVWNTFNTFAYVRKTFDCTRGRSQDHEAREYPGRPRLKGETPLPFTRGWCWITLEGHETWDVWNTFECVKHIPWGQRKFLKGPETWNLRNTYFLF